MIDRFCKEYCKYFNTIPRSVLEIGSRDGNDASFIANYFSVPSDKVFVVEPHPKHINHIKQTYPEFNLFEVAISDKLGIIEFDVIESRSWDETGRSSLLSRSPEYPIYNDDQVLRQENWHKVVSIPGRTLLNEINLPEIDLVKIDVEGATYEVLKSFGSDIKKLKFIHLEAEYVQFWKNQKLYSDVANLLLEYGFKEAYKIDLGYDQCDTVWYRL
jgi:FkbM family methyltransferase